MVKLKKKKNVPKKPAQVKPKKTLRRVAKIKPAVKPKKEKAAVKAKKAIPPKPKPSIMPAPVRKPVETIPVKPVEIPKPIIKEEIKEARAEKKIEVKVAAPVLLKELELELPITVKDLAVRLQEKPSVIIKTLMNMGIMVGINQTLEEATVVKVCQKYGCKIKKAPSEEELALHIHNRLGPVIEHCPDFTVILTDNYIFIKMQCAVLYK